MSFDVHPVTGDLIRIINDGAVKTSVRNIVYTNKTERFFNPLLAGSIKHYLFEPMTPQTTYDIQQGISQALYNYEPRITQLNVNVTPDFLNDAYNISIQFRVLNIVNPVTLSLTLERLS